MLTPEERRQVLVVYRYFCRMNQFPVEVHPEHWSIRPHNCGNWNGTWKTKWTSKVSYALYVAHAAYKCISFFYVSLLVPGTKLHQMVIHAMYAAAPVIYAMWYYLVFIKFPGLNASVMKMTLTGAVIQGNTMHGFGAARRNNNKGKDTQAGRRSPLECSLQDLIAIWLPHMILLCILLILICIIFDPSLTLLLYSALPEKYQNWLFFSICFLEEMRFLLFLGGIVVPIWQVQVIAFDLSGIQLEGIVKHGRKRNIGRLYMSLRCLQLYVNLLNIINRYIIFTWKLLCIGMCIICGSAAIAHFKEHPVYGIMYYSLFFDLALTYTSLYEKAFRIPNLFHEARMLLRIQSRGVRAAAGAKMLKMQLQSIPTVGIKVGDFHTLERESTPVFLDYVLKNVVNMLVAYG